MQKIRLYILGIFIVLSSVSTSFAQGLSVSPSRIFFSLAPQQATTQRITFSNTGTDPIILKAWLKDWYRDSLGEKVYVDTNKLEYSNAAWIRVVPEMIEVAPGAKQEVTVTMTLPNNRVAREHVTNSMLFFTQLNEQKGAVHKVNGRNIGVNVKLEVGVHVYHTPPGFTKKEIEFLAFNDLGKVMVKDTVRRLGLKIQNTGNIVNDGEIRFEVTNKATGEELQIPTRSVSLLPGAIQVLYLDLPPHLTGTYLAVAILDSGSETNLKVAEKEITYGR